MAQINPFFVKVILWREVFGLIFTACYALLVFDLLTIGKTEQRPMIVAKGEA